MEQIETIKSCKPSDQNKSFGDIDDKFDQINEQINQRIE